MSETTNTTTETTETAIETAPVESPFPAILAKTGQPEAVTNMIADKLNGLFNLVIRHNSRALRIQQTKAADPSNVEVLDSIWANAADSKTAPAEILALEEEYQALIAETEKMRKKLRAFAATQIKPPLSPEQLEKERKAANEEAILIEKEKAAAEAMAGIADQYLTLANAPVDGGILSLIPAVESIKSQRGRKAAGGTSGGVSYRTRLDSVIMNGVLQEKGGKSNFQIAADSLNREFNAAKFDDNAVDDIELEKRMYEAHNATFRDSAALPEELEFTFTKDIVVQNTNDDSTHIEPRTVQFKVVRNVRKDMKKDAETPVTETAKPEGETAKPETKTETKPEAEKAPANVPAPASKKAAAIQDRAAKK